MLLHNVIPHLHHDEISADRHQQVHLAASTPLDYLMLLLHIDMGDNHLESFDKQDGSGFEVEDIAVLMDSNPSPFVIEFEVYPTIVRKNSLLPRDSIIVFNDTFLLQCSLFRGPPTIA